MTQVKRHLFSVLAVFMAVIVAVFLTQSVSAHATPGSESLPTGVSAEKLPDGRTLVVVDGENFIVDLVSDDEYAEIEFGDGSRE